MAAKPISAHPKKSEVEMMSDLDDVCTDLLVDKVEFWSEIHKMADHYKAKRNVSDREILDIIRSLVRGRQTREQAAESVLKYLWLSGRF